MISCKNCTQTFEGKYCPECGQKASTKRFSTKILFSELIDKIFPLDRGVLYTSQRLMFSPGPMLREYLDGKRIHYTKPLQYLLLMVTLSLLLFSQDQFEQGFKDGVGEGQSEAVLKFQKQILDVFFSNFSMIFLPLIPFLAFFSKRLFKRSDLNFAEHLVLNCYLMAGCTLASMPLAIIFRILGQDVFNPVAISSSSAVYLLFFAWAYVAFFKPKNAILGGSKAILTFLLAYFLYILLFTLSIGIGVAIYVGIWGK